MEPKLFIAGKAFIRCNGRILIIKESAHYTDGTNAGQYDVVGGRLKVGQDFKDSLLREIKEETGLKVTLGKPFFVHEWRPIVRGETWQIVGVFLEAESDTETVNLSPDHDSFFWIDPIKYQNYPLITNLKPAFEAYLEKR